MHNKIMDMKDSASEEVLMFTPKKERFGPIHDYECEHNA